MEPAAAPDGRPPFVVISGLIGAGKSTLATALGPLLSLPVFHEPVAESEYLEDFYREPAEYGFPMQVWLLTRRLQQHEAIVAGRQGGVQDRSLYEDQNFARLLAAQGLMEDRDLQTYLTLVRTVAGRVAPPDLVLHLDVRPETALARIRARGRPCERAITLQYLQGLHQQYERWLAEVARDGQMALLRVPWDQDHRDPGEVAARVLERRGPGGGVGAAPPWQSGAGGV